MIAVQNVAANQDDPVGLYLSPNLCLLSKDESDCQIEIEIRWKTEAIGHYCLASNYQEKALACWNNTQAERLTVNLKLNRNIQIALFDNESGETLFVKPVRLQRQITRYRKKRRNPWRFY